jgi:protein phosphatase
VAVIVIPDPSLVLLVGAAGAGKTTFAARHFDPSEVLSSDAFRAWIAGDEADQRATRPAFAALHREVDRRLAAGRLTVVDATNVEVGARRALVARARAASVPAIAIVLDLPPGAIHARNLARSQRVVETAIVDRHLRRLRSALDAPGEGLATEGFARVVVLRDDASVASVRLRRERP